VKKLSNILEDDKFRNFLNKHGEQIKGLAKKVNPETLSDEKQLKQTLKMLATMANVPADDKKLDDIVKLLKKQKFDPKDPNSISKMLDNIKPKK